MTIKEYTSFSLVIIRLVYLQICMHIKFLKEIDSHPCFFNSTTVMLINTFHIIRYTKISTLKFIYLIYDIVSKNYNT